MTYKLFCDRCDKQIYDDTFIKLEYKENGKYRFGHYHVDCFNYEFSCDIRNITIEKAQNGDYNNDR